jgi:hypothetical protein
VSVIANGMRRIIDSGNILVKNDRYYVENVRIHLLNVPGSQEVVVELINKQQSIHFKTGEQPNE